MLPAFPTTAWLKTIDFYFFQLLFSFFCDSKLNQLTASLQPFPFLNYFFISYENSTKIVNSHKPGSSFPWDDFAWILMYYFYSLNLQFVLIFIFPIFERSLSVILQVMTKGLKTRIHTGNLTFLCKCCVHRINVWYSEKYLKVSVDPTLVFTFIYSTFIYKTFRVKNPKY